MRWYQVVRNDNAVANPFVADHSNIEAWADSGALYSSAEVEDWPIDAFLLADEPANDGVPDDVLQNYLGVPIYSERLRTALREAGVGGIRYLPLQVRRPGGQSIPGFAVAQVLNVVAALDADASVLERFPDDYFLPQRRGKVRAVRHPVLRSSVLEGLDAIRLSEYPISMLVSERFREAFERHRCTGYSFTPISLAM